MGKPDQRRLTRNDGNGADLEGSCGPGVVLGPTHEDHLGAVKNVHYGATPELLGEKLG